jgi:2-polyprenyl-3-methyl-5-hydroxy-6-metoxy-1,4-benzoquinol methylase
MRKFFYFLLDLLLLRTWHVKKALKKLAPELPSDASVLDAGAGFGQYTWRMSIMNPKWKIKAVDIDPDHIAGCNSFFKKAGLSGRVKCEVLDLIGLKEADTFNLILSVDVMEHIKEDELVFRNFCQALIPGGSLLISTPSDKGGSDVHDEEDQSFIDEHVRNGYGISDISQKLKNVGFKNINASYTYGTPGAISWHLSMKYPVKMLNISKIYFLVLPFYYLIIFPVALFLNFLDVSITHNSGTGLLVIASK